MQFDVLCWKTRKGRTIIMEWKLAYAHHGQCEGVEPKTISEIENSGWDIIPAIVPGNFELDLMREGKIEDLYFSTNTLKAQELEDVHVWYYTTVEIENKEQYLHFEGIDTYADIYVNGEWVKWQIILVCSILTTLL